MYSSFVSLDEVARSAQRIFDPFSYRPIIRERFVPVSMAECFALAVRSPIVWQRNDHGDLELIAVRSLHPDADVPGIGTLSREALPFLLQAFPFRFRDIASGDFEIGLDRCAPMRERDGGSYIYDDRGNMLPGAELKLRALEEYRRNRATEAAILQSAIRHDMLEPVVLPDDLRARHRLPDFVVVVATPDDPLLLQDLPKDTWMAATRFLTAQRLSLYTMGRLVALAEAAA